MKIKPQHFEQMKRAVTEVFEKNPNIKTVYKNAGLSDMRFRWDVLHACQIDGIDATRWICDNLYPYLNDTHIDTALRNIIPAN